jgi:hypothetical protein
MWSRLRPTAALAPTAAPGLLLKARNQVFAALMIVHTARV